jgi:arylsulfatase A-like enzyme
MSISSINARRFAILLLACAGLSAGMAQSAPGPAAPSPNVIIILADDLGYQDVGFNGCRDIPTPHIDRIATEGVKFTNGYVSYAVCGPSRAGLITGRYQDRFGFGRNPLFAPNDPQMGLPRSEETLAEVLQRAGYRSIAIGKWHLGAHPSLRPLQRGFDAFFGFLSGGHSYFPAEWTLPDEYAVAAQFDAYHTKLLRNEERVEENAYLTDALSREAVRYVEQYHDQPFFLYLAYNAPHTPLQATEKYLSRFDTIADPKRRTYAAMVSAVDDGVGLLLAKLAELGIEEQTMIFFLSDNGGPESHNASDNGILRGGKGDLLEGGIRVPFALRWPGRVPAGIVYEQPVISLDIFATAVARVAPPLELAQPPDGVDLLPYVRGERDGSPHAWLYWRKFDQAQHAVRNAAGDKLLARNDRERLFNLQENISEEPALIREDSLARRALEQAYADWVSEMKDPVFQGLLQDTEYSAEHPDRFKRPE